MSESSKIPGKNTEIFRASSLLTATAIWSFANGASAQDAAPTDAAEGAETIEEVVVTGFRASLNKALEAKQEQVGSIDMIVAEDIADFPDLNLAESLQRVPGVVIARDAGEGRQISVRGLGPQFTRVRINGIEAMSANGSTDASGGTNRGRNFDFNTFASELFNNITVRKTAAAETEEGSLGATVDLQTGRPFDYDGLTIAGSVQAGYNDLTEDSDPRAAFLVSNTFADGKFGALLSVAYTSRKLEDDGSSTVRWQTATPAPAELLRCPLANPTASADRPSQAHAGRRSAPHSSRAFRATTNTSTIRNDSASRPRCSSHRAMQPRSAWTRCTRSSTPTRDEIFLETPVFSTGGNAMTRTGINDVNPVAAEIDGNEHPGVRRIQRRGHSLRSASRRTDHEVHAGHPRRQTRVQRCLQHACPGGFRRSEPRQPGADDAAVRCAQYRRLQLRLPRRTAACRSSRTARRTSPIRRPGPHADPPASAEHDQQLSDRAARFRVGGIRCLLAEVRPAVEELHLQVHRSCAVPTAPPPTSKAFVRSRLRSASYSTSPISATA